MGEQEKQPWLSRQYKRSDQTSYVFFELNTTGSYLSQQVITGCLDQHVLKLFLLPD